MFLVILGLIWKRLSLSKILLKATFWLVVYGSFTNLLAVIVAAVTGYGEMMPLAGGKKGTQTIEGLISFLLISLTLSMLGGLHCCFDWILQTHETRVPGVRGQVRGCPYEGNKIM